MKIKKILMLFFMLTIFLLSGCKLTRDVEVTPDSDDGGVKYAEGIESKLEEVHTAFPVVVESGPNIDGDALTKALYGEDMQTLIDGGFLNLSIAWQEAYDRDDASGFTCNKDGYYTRVVFKNDINESYFEYEDKNERSGSRYGNVIPDDFMKNEFSNRVMEFYQEGELELCSKEEALVACAPIAQACGYGDAQADVYVMNKESMNTFAEESSELGKCLFGAPDPNFDYEETEKEIERLKEESEAAKDAGNIDLYVELRRKYVDLVAGLGMTYIEWTDEMEAYLIVYRSVMEGLVLDSSFYQMYCVYSPHYGRVVYAIAKQPYVQVKTLEETELITRKAAVEETLRELNMTDGEGVTITGISLVYSPRGENMSVLKFEKIVNPCWRIDYQLSDEIKESYGLSKDDGTLLIDAVDGRETSFAN